MSVFTHTEDAPCRWRRHRECARRAIGLILATDVELQTVAAMTSFFLAMSCFPEAQRKAQAEIDALIGKSRLPTLKDRDALPYLNALMLEVLRWIPVAPMGESEPVCGAERRDLMQMTI